MLSLNTILKVHTWIDNACINCPDGDKGEQHGDEFLHFCSANLNKYYLNAVKYLRILLYQLVTFVAFLYPTGSLTTCQEIFDIFWNALISKFASCFWDKFVQIGIRDKFR